MKTQYLAVIALAFAFGCEDEDVDDGFDSFDPTGDTMDTGVDIVTPTFRLDSTDWESAITTTCGDGDRLQIVLEADGVGFDGEIWIFDTYEEQAGGPAYDEKHDMTKTDASVPEQRSVFELDVQAATTFPNDDYEDGVATTFRCSNLELPGAYITYAAKIDDQDVGVSDCIVFGEDADAILTQVWDGLDYPAWLTAENCTAL